MYKEIVYRIETRTGNGTIVKFTKDRPKFLDTPGNCLDPVRVSNLPDPKILVAPSRRSLKKNKKSR